MNYNFFIGVDVSKKTLDFTNWREQDLYGSSRLGMWSPNINLANNNASTVWDTIGHKQYELTNHLGNVLATITDKRIPHSSDGTTVDYYNPETTTAQDYYAFGFQVPKRGYTLDKPYRYGFNGKENDNDVKVDFDGNEIPGAQQDYGMRIYDPRVGRFLSVDPLTPKYPELTPYQFASDNPIENIDLDGLEGVPAKRQPNGDLSMAQSSTYRKTVVAPRPKIGVAPAKIVMEQTIAMADRTGRGWIGPAKSYVLPNVAAVEQAHRDEVSDNVRGGVLGASLYLAGGDKWSYVGAVGDGVAMSFGGVQAPGVFPRPVEVPEPELTLTKPKGAANPNARAAIDLGNRVHYDQLNGGAGVGLPTELSLKYPNTTFRFSSRGASGVDVTYTGGIHPSDYPGSTWIPGNNFGDFKPATPGGTRSFNNDINSGKFPKNTQKLNYDPITGKLQ